MNEREGQRKQGFYNILNEAFAYRYLISRGSENVMFFEKIKNRNNPDIIYKYNNELRCCEVKTLGISNVEVTKRKEQFLVHDNANYEKLSDRFTNKFSDAINTAKQQINAFGTKGLIYIFINFDDFTYDHYQNYRNRLVNYSENQKFENLFIKIGLYGNR